jgi:hypothetical protein
VPESYHGGTFEVGDRVTTADDPTHGGTIKNFDYSREYASVLFDQRHEHPYPLEEIHVDDLLAFRDEQAQ